MLVLSRDIDERIVIEVPAGPARRIEVAVVDSNNVKARLGFEADTVVQIWRKELLPKEACGAESPQI